MFNFLKSSEPKKEETKPIQELARDRPKRELPLKVVVIGGPVGKTSLVRRYTVGMFSKEYVPTIGFDIMSYNLKYNPSDIDDIPGAEQSLRNSKIILQFWDVSHLEVRGSQKDLILTDADGIIAVTDWTEEV
jgi:GTPase SAR1 family protein